MIKMITEGCAGEHIFSSLPPSGHPWYTIYTYQYRYIDSMWTKTYISDEVFTYIINKWPLYKMSMDWKKKFYLISF